MTAKSILDRSGLSTDHVDTIEHFEADYNAVDQFLRKMLGVDKQASFSYLVKEYSRKHTGWPDAGVLLTIADVRNAIVHGKTEAYCYVAVPTPPLVQKLRVCRDRLMHPARAIPTFQRKVEAVSNHDTLARVLKIIAQRKYSQFPVYESERFRGLLTENGITRWLANHVANKLSLVELADVPVKEVLENEEKRKNYQFVAREFRVDDVRALFAGHELLEAVLVTASGKDSESLLGIATRWDTTSLT